MKNDNLKSTKNKKRIKIKLEENRKTYYKKDIITTETNVNLARCKKQTEKKKTKW